MSLRYAASEEFFLVRKLTEMFVFLFICKLKKYRTWLNSVKNS